MDVQELIYIFYSGYDAFLDWETLYELSTLIKDGIIFYKKEKACTKEDYFDAIDQVKGIEGPGSQGKGHMALKAIAQEYLTKKSLESWVEYRFLGGRPDVLSKDFTWVIECGNTNPDSPPSFLEDERVKIFSVLPYPYQGEDYLTIHLFSRGKNFDQYMSNKTKRLKTVFEEFHRKNS